jgi:glycerophosphoryl diester phosphodiesterase
MLTYAILLSEHDLYYYLKDRPPNFWLAAGVGGVLLVGAIAVGAWLSIRWAFALPILLFEKQSARAALRATSDRVRGVAWRVGFLLGGWLFGALLIGVGLDVAFRLIAAAILESAGERPVAVILALLVVHGGLVATWSFVLIVGLALASRRLYLLRSEQLGLILPDGPQTPGTEKSVTPWNWRLAVLCLPIFLVAPLVLWLNLWRYVTTVRPPVQVTAHRGNARAAPENTLSAIRKAIESGADYVEMDVQQTADGVVVLLHDRDLKRVSGVSRRLEELSFEEVRRLTWAAGSTPPSPASASLRLRRSSSCAAGGSSSTSS